MKKLFTAIRHSDLDMVKELLHKKPELVNCTAKQPPKKDDGQSPLQIALKTGNFEIADYLLSLGADVNFMEADTSCNTWRAPVIHDAITAAIMSARWNTNSEVMGGMTVHSTKEKADQAFALLEKLIQLGADVNARNSYGNSCIWIACSQAKQILPTYNHVENRLHDDRLLTNELRADLSRIFDLLIRHGADLSYVGGTFDRTVTEFYKNEPVFEFLRQG